MTYDRLSPADLLAGDFQAPEFTERPWTVRWDELDEPVEDFVMKRFPPVLDFFTSGTTGERRRWRRSREQLWAEASLLAAMIGPDRPEAVLSFAPPRHLYGALVSLLVPAKLGLPVWYRPQFAAMPPQPHRRWAVMAIPWTFRILLQRASWVRSLERVSVVHSTSVLPATAADLLAKFPETASLLELFGSTETGAIATRRWSGGNPPWELCPDVEFALPRPESTTEGEVPLTVRSPRLARFPDGRAPDSWEMDDRVRIIDARRFGFAGRRGRLVNVNGRRIDLELIEERLRSSVSCADLACTPVTDPLIGEHFDLLIVPGGGRTGADLDLAAALAELECRPRKVVPVDRIDRSETGKLRRVQMQPISNTGVQT
ncbi:AMP-binding protein [Nocardiopsis ansamitocini]|uniref:AMP-dependent synthetase/ligase domain-containing protein n=1 Tax=Nocardiopsis ansamitocini TaxID=1670832 RepID=A0A9W6PAC7_9ACTN|nr:AMP-binding protein [Nocardiopsis ansamitocini]GLU50036.1 hypothetical protein Nans01_43870 [Nocardiopsis ansamitocini]